MADKRNKLLNPIRTSNVPVAEPMIILPKLTIEQIISCCVAPIFGFIISMIIAQFAAITPFAKNNIMLKLRIMR